MAFLTADRVKETTTTTGTGTVDLDGASTGFVTFASVTTTLDDVYYVIANNVTGEFEVGQGVVTHGTPDTLTRSTVISSSNAGAKVDFGSGTKDVFMTAPAEKILQIDPDNDLNVSADDITLTPDATGSVGVYGDFYLYGSIPAAYYVNFDQSVNKLKFRDNVFLAFGSGSGTDGDVELTYDGSSLDWNQKNGVLYFQDDGAIDILWNPGAYFRLYNDTALQLGSSGTFSMDFDTTKTAVVFNDTQTTKDLRFSQAGTDKIIFSFDNWEFQDGVTASFGAGSDLSIEHDGTNSLITNTTGDLNIQTSGSLVYQLDDDTSASGPTLNLYRNSTSPAGGDILARVTFDGKNAAAEDINYASFRARIRDATDAAEDGALQFFCMRNGTETQFLKYDTEEDASGEVVLNYSQFDINFKVKSSNKTHALFVDGANGVIGMGDSSPSGRLSRTTSGAVGRSTTGFEYVASRSDTTVNPDNFIGGYLFQTNDSSGTTKWGGVSAKADDTSGNGVLEFFPVTNTYETSSNEGLMQLADTNDLYLRAGGIRVNRSEKNVYRAVEESIVIYHSGSGSNDTYTQMVGRDGTGGDPVFRHQRRGTIKSEIEENGDFLSATNNYGPVSDGRLKENIVDSGSQWDDVKAIQIKKYSFIEDGLDEPNMIGVVAQDLLAAGMSGLVKQKFLTDAEDNPILDADGNQDYIYTVKGSVMQLKALKALQEAMAKIETLEAENTSIKARLDALEAG